MLPISKFSCWCLFAVIALFSAHANAAPPPAQTPNVNKCNNKNSLSILPVTDLSFGAYDGTTGGTITVTPDGAVITSGPDIAGNTANAAAFEVSNTEDGCHVYPVEIILPASTTITEPGTGAAMTISTFTSSPENQFTLGSTPGSVTTVYIGATLTSAPTQTGGIYAGPFDITFEHVDLAP
jgi:Flp pilus assembly protein TadG